MAHHNLEKLLEPLAAALDDVVAEAVREHLAWQRRDRNARALALKYVAEVLKVRVAAANGALPQLEGGDVGAADNLIVRVHVAADAVRARVADLLGPGR